VFIRKLFILESSEFGPKQVSKLGLSPNPAHKAWPDLQLWAKLTF